MFDTFIVPSVPSKYPEPLSFAARVNGWNGEMRVSPTRVMVKLLVLLSTKRLDWQVRSWVLVIAVSGAVGGVKAEV